MAFMCIVGFAIGDCLENKPLKLKNASEASTELQLFWARKLLYIR